MPNSSTEPETDQNVVLIEQQVKDTIDPDIRLLSSFSLITREGDLLIVHLCARKWLNFQESQHKLIETRLPGDLRCLPPEIRFMIYDFTMPGTDYYIHPNSDKSGSSMNWPLFRAPLISRVCREMRQYAMRTYQFVWSNITTKFSFYPGFSFNPRLPLHSQSDYSHFLSDIYGEWWAHKYQHSGLGFFDTRKDTLDIGSRSVAQLNSVEDVAVKWDDPFKAPEIASGKIRVKRFSVKERLRVL
ncbi:hypothetical protein F5Y08DRAFT_350125 [Xylaria arbuscula]|nr:hypothetical protein F5Y08DRAFT_350125 [Xylaria arbuscula]